MPPVTKDPKGCTVASVQMDVTASEMVISAVSRILFSSFVGERKLQKSTSSAHR